MRPTPIPDAEIWEGATRAVFSAPDGDLTHDHIAPVEALVDSSGVLGVPRVNVRCVLEDGDLERLQAGGQIWISFYGCLIPFSTQVKGPGE